MKKRRAAFTLIELLVVIAIIAVLIALLAARRPGGARGGPAVPVRQQPEADRPGDAQLQRRPTTRCRWAGPSKRGPIDPSRSRRGSWGSWSRPTSSTRLNFSLSSYDPSNVTGAAVVDQQLPLPVRSERRLIPTGLILPGFGSGGVNYRANEGTSVAMWYGADDTTNVNNGIVQTPPNGLFYSDQLIRLVQHHRRDEQHGRLQRARHRRLQQLDLHRLQRHLRAGDASR